MKRIRPGPGQESVWDYPRPPALSPSEHHVVVVAHGTVIAETRQAIRVLETSHPPTWYIPSEDVWQERVAEAPGESFCEFKGRARYWNVLAGDTVVPRAGWSYPNPTAAFAAIRGHLTFYPSKLECYVEGERVRAQEGDFYGGWITSDVVGPFKGGPGTWGW